MEAESAVPGPVGSSLLSSLLESSLAHLRPASATTSRRTHEATHAHDPAREPLPTFPPHTDRAEISDEARRAATDILPSAISAADRDARPSGATSPVAPNEPATPPEPASAATPSDRSETTGPPTASLRGESPEDSDQLAELRARDAEVRSHEQAHKSAGGQYAGAIHYDYTTGPDGRRYAVGGHVPIDVSPVAGDPRATIEKMDQVRRAALAPADPSAADRRVAARAARTAGEARAELLRNGGDVDGDSQDRAGNRADPASRVPGSAPSENAPSENAPTGSEQAGSATTSAGQSDASSALTPPTAAETSASRTSASPLSLAADAPATPTVAARAREDSVPSAPGATPDAAEPLRSAPLSQAPPSAAHDKNGAGAPAPRNTSPLAARFAPPALPALGGSLDRTA